MDLLLNEKLIISSNDDKVVLTNYRVFMKNKSWVNNYYISIFLEDISSVENKYTSKIMYLFYALFSVLTSIISINITNINIQQILTSIGVLAALIFFVLWSKSRKNIISITSNGGTKLEFLVDGMSEKNIENFINDVLNAKQIKTTSDKIKL